ncbi:MAG: hypothetical protein ABIJ42_01970 [Acidobacteriota bacterium]
MEFLGWTGLAVVTESQLAWLGVTGQLRDMSNHPQALPCYDGSALELRELLKTMPAGWSQPSPNPIEDPADDPIETPGPVDPPGEGDEIVQLLRSINEGVQHIVGFIEQIRLPH